MHRLLAMLALLASSASVRAAEADFGAVQSLLQARCVLCHNGPAAPLGLRLDSHAGVLAGSSNGPVVLAGQASASELIRRVRGERQPRMPMTGPPWLTDVEVGLLEAWIDAGLPPAIAANAAVAVGTGGVAITPAARPAGSAAPDDQAAASSEDTVIARPAEPMAAIEAPSPSAAVEDQRPLDFNAVAVILAQRCAKCHTEQGLLGAAPEGLRLTSHAAALASDERARVVPGQPEASELLRRIRGQSLPRMPFDGPPWLSAAEIEQIERWIADGARDGQGQPAALPVGARVRLGGHLSAAAELDGLPLRVDGGTRRDKSPRSGDQVEVRGRIEADGGIRVERLRRR